MMDDEERGVRSFVLVVGLGVVVGSITVGTGTALSDGRLILLGVLVIVLSILVPIAFRLSWDGKDDFWVIEPSSPQGFAGNPDPSPGNVHDGGPGNCPACGGALFYGRLNCPHCSTSIFQGAGAGVRPPEF
jgi:hypothetical protein